MRGLRLASLVLALAAGERAAHAGAWTVEHVEGAPDLAAVFAVGDDLVVVGRAGLLRHRRGGSWSTAKIPVLNDLTVVAGSGADDVWAAGVAGAMVHWDGATWSSVASESTGAIRGLAAPAAGAAIAVTEKQINRWRGEHWDPMKGRPKITGMRAVAALDANGERAVAVGDAGLVVDLDGEKATKGAAGEVGLRAVAACPGGEAVAVGVGAALRRQKDKPPGKWKTLAAPPVEAAGAVARCQAGKVTHVAAVALGGEDLLVFDVKAGTWSRETVEKGAKLTGLAAVGAGLVVVGEDGLVATTATW